MESVIGIVLMGTLHCTMACGRRWLKANHPGTVLSISATYAPGRLGLRRSLRRFQSGRRSAHAQPRRGMGQSRHPHERHRSRPNPDAGRVLPRAAASANSKPSRSTAIRCSASAPSRTSQPSSVSCQRWLSLHQWRSHPHGRRRVPARRGRIQQSGKSPQRRRLAGNQAKEKISATLIAQIRGSIVIPHGAVEEPAVSFRIPQSFFLPLVLRRHHDRLQHQVHQAQHNRAHKRRKKSTHLKPGDKAPKPTPASAH